MRVSNSSAATAMSRATTCPTLSLERPSMSTELVRHPRPVPSSPASPDSRSPSRSPTTTIRPPSATPDSRNRRSIREPGRVPRIVGTEDTQHRSLGNVSMRKDVTQRQQLVDDGIDALRHGELAGIETDLGVQGGLVGIIDTGEAHGFPCGQSCPGLRVHSLDVALFADFDRG